MAVKGDMSRSLVMLRYGQIGISVWWGYGWEGDMSVGRYGWGGIWAGLDYGCGGDMGGVGI